MTPSVKIAPELITLARERGACCDALEWAESQLGCDLGDLATDWRRWVAGNAATPPDVLRALSTDPETDVRYRVAGNAATPPDVLRALSTDPNPYVRRWVADNAATPPNVLWGGE